MLYLLDTTVLIDFLRGAPAVDRIDEVLDRGDRLCTSAINVEELSRGALPADRERVASLVQGLGVVPLGAHEGWQAGEWRRSYAERGTTFSQADCLIGAAALTARARLATGNPKDFPMKEIDVEHWPVGR